MPEQIREQIETELDEMSRNMTGRAPSYAENEFKKLKEELDKTIEASKEVTPKQKEDIYNALDKIEEAVTEDFSKDKTGELAADDIYMYKDLINNNIEDSFTPDTPGLSAKVQAAITVKECVETSDMSPEDKELAVTNAFNTITLSTEQKQIEALGNKEVMSAAMSEIMNTSPDPAVDFVMFVNTQKFEEYKDEKTDTLDKWIEDADKEIEDKISNLSDEEKEEFEAKKAEEEREEKEDEDNPYSTRKHPLYG